MKNLKKALAAVMALSVMSWSCAAFAEVSATGAFSGGNGAVSADYSEIGDNKVTATVDTSLANVGTEMTFLILDDGTNVASINEADILYIDQQTLTAGNNSFTGVINLARIDGGTGAEALPAGSYPIRVGYYYDDNGEQTFGLAAATMVVSYESGEEQATIKVLWGDVDGNGAIAALDVSAVLLGSLGMYKDCTLSDGVNELAIAVGDDANITDGENTETVIWGDIDGNGAIAALDVSAVLLGSLGMYKDCTIGDIAVTVGDECDVIVPAE